MIGLKPTTRLDILGDEKVLGPFQTSRLLLCDHA